MALGMKTRRYLLVQRNPAAALLEQMDAMEGSVRNEAQAATQKAIKPLIDDTTVYLNRMRELLRLRADEIADTFAVQLKQDVRAKIDSLPHLHGDAGYTPKKGIDYFDGTPGDDGHTPTDEEILALIEPLIPQVTDGATPTKEELTALIMPIARRFAQEFTIEPMKAGEIARAIEALPYAEKLDYEKGLKNKPGTPVAETRHTLHRGGGGKETYEYDLSAFCDGNTRVFTVPSNTRIVLVQCTDAPSGIYRKTVDWTGTGTTTLTLNAALFAPSAGATLSILYVV